MSNKIGNIENSDNNNIVQNEIKEQKNYYVVNGDESKYQKMRFSHKLFPYYIVDIKQNKDGIYTLYSRPFRDDSELIYPINYKGSIKITDERYKNIKNNELLFDLIQHVDTPIEVKFENYKKYLGKVEDPYPDANAFLMSKNEKAFIMPEKVKIPDVGINVDFNIKNSKNSIKNIKLKTSKIISKSHLIMNNYHQKNKIILFTFDFDFDNKKFNCRVNYNINNKNYNKSKSRLKYNQFCLDFLTNKYYVTDRKTKENIMQGKYDNLISDDSIESLTKYIQIIKKIIKIEKFLNIEFEVPEEITSEDVSKINELYKYIIATKKSIKLKDITYTMQKKDISKQQLLDYMEKDSMVLTNKIDNIAIKILNKEINIKQIIEKYDNVKLGNTTEVSEIIKQFDDLSDEYKIIIKMVSAIGKNFSMTTEINM
ncbi:MAG: hypothetical protein IKG58_03275 [Bacilli bacterium]|nr:hypothetical protein [Bacilli bacterium]MBR3049559.1 hypothetical protein [Bacilli bacterium]